MHDGCGILYPTGCPLLCPSQSKGDDDGKFLCLEHRDDVSIEGLRLRTINFSLYIVVYNFIIGVLVMIASEKLGEYAGRLIKSRRAPTARIVRLVTFTFGACVAVLSAGIYLANYVFKVV